MARAEIAQTFDADGNCLSLTMTVEGDVLDSAETYDDVTQRAVVMWKCIEDD